MENICYSYLTLDKHTVMDDIIKTLYSYDSIQRSMQLISKAE